MDHFVAAACKSVAADPSLLAVLTC